MIGSFEHALIGKFRFNRDRYISATKEQNLSCMQIETDFDKWNIDVGISKIRVKNLNLFSMSPNR